MSIIVKKGNVTIQNYVQTGANLTQNYNAPVYFGADKARDAEDESLCLEPEAVKEAIDSLMQSNQKQNKRWWFVPYVVLRDNRVVADLGGFEAYVRGLYGDELPLPMDTHDLSKELEAGCFAKPFADWTPDKAPVSGTTYERYKKLVAAFLDLLRE